MLRSSVGSVLELKSYLIRYKLKDSLLFQRMMVALSFSMNMDGVWQIPIVNGPQLAHNWMQQSLPLLRNGCQKQLDVLFLGSTAIAVSHAFALSLYLELY